MSKIRLYGETSGYVELQAPAVAADNTVNIGDIPQFSGVPSDGDLMRYDAGAGDWRLVSNGYVYAGQVRFTSDGTFEKANPLGTGDIGLRAIRVRLVGGGGGGAGCPANPGATSFHAGRGGGGGGYGESFITDIAGLDTSVTVTRGLGGAGGAAGANSGSAGGTSSFGALVSATGGGGGVFGATVSDQTFCYLATPAGGGATITADLAVPGFSAGPDVVAGGFNFAISSPSGGSHLAGNLAGRATNTSLAGLNGRANGGGANGAVSRGSSGAAAQAGGTGGNGIVIIDCYV